MSDQAREMMQQEWAAALRGLRTTAPGDNRRQLPSHQLSELLRYAECAYPHWTEEERLRAVCLRLQEMLDSAMGQLIEAAMTQPGPFVYAGASVERARLEIIQQRREHFRTRQVEEEG